MSHLYATVLGVFEATKLDSVALLPNKNLGHYNRD